MTTGWGFKTLLVLLALAAWPYLAIGPLWLMIPAMALPMALGRWAPAPGLGILLGLAPLVDGLVAWCLLGSPDHGDQVGMASWIEPAALGLAAGMILRLQAAPHEKPARLPGLALFLFAAGASLLLAVARLAPDWQAQLPWFGIMAWMSLPDASPWVMEYTLRSALLLMAGAGWFALLRRVLPGPGNFVPAAAGWIVGSVVTGIYGTWTWSQGMEPQWPYAASLFEDKNSYGSYLVLTLFLAAALWGFNRDRWLRLLALVGFLLAIWMLLLSGSKAALAAVAAAALYVALDSLARQSGRRALRLLPALLLAGVLAAWGSQVLLPQRVSLTLVRVSTPSFMTDYLVTKRVPVWTAATRAWAEHPILGLGPGLLWRSLGQYHDADLDGWKPEQENAHNQFLQVAADTGIVGLAGFVLLLAVPLRRALTGKERSPAAPRLMALGVLCYLGSALTGHPLLLSRQVFLFWSAVALMVMLSPAPSPGQPIASGSLSGWPRRPAAGAGLAALIIILALMVQPFRRPCLDGGSDAPGTAWEFTAGFHVPELDEINSWRWMKSAAEMRLCSSSGLPREISPSLEMASFHRPRDLNVYNRGKATESLAIPLLSHRFTLHPQPGRDGQAISFILRPHPGAERVADAMDSPDRRRLSLQVFTRMDDQASLPTLAVDPPR
jgi:O-antigen ligase